MIPAIAFVGRSGSGKTVLISQLVALLRARGHRVGTAKHVSHGGEIDLAEKDSFRHRAAGAERTLLVTDSSLVLFSDREPEEPLEETIERTFAGLDLVLLEGFKEGPSPKIEVYCPLGRDAARPLAWQMDVLGVVTTAPAALPPGTRAFSPGAPLRIVEFLEERFLGGRRT